MNAESKVLITVLKHRRVLLGELSSLTRCPSEVVVGVLRKHQDVIKIHREEVVVSNPVSIALKLLGMNVELRVVSEMLDWRDFELFSSHILIETGYSIVHGLKITSPVRFEIDVFAVEPSTGFSIAIDCKHWSTRSPGRLIDAAIKHLERVKKMIAFFNLVKSRYRVVGQAKLIVPVIVTLLTPTVRVHEGVLMLSIGELPHFVVERYAVMDYFEVKPIKIKS